VYKRMLVPLDGSEVAEVVFPYAREIASRLGAEVILLHIANPALRDFQPMNQAYIDHAAETVRRGAPSLVVKGALANGYPSDEIIKFAEENKVDLIVIATHGRSGARRTGMGSVADRVLKAAKIPVVLVPSGDQSAVPFDQWPNKELIVPLDGSELAETVLPHVEALAGAKGLKGARVVLVRACEPPAMPTYYSPELSEIPLHWGQYAQQETARCKQVSTEYLANVERRLKDRGIDVRSEVLMGKASDEVVNYASKDPHRLVVMATHGRSGLSRLVYGSVALNVLVGVSNPIFLVKPAAK
jgi:nucleotide-binding universal stress UspA family protein